jgi:hypothetical protein
MNSTNRFLNRAFAFVVGLIVLALGLGAIAVASVPVVRAGYRETAPTVVEDLTGFFAASPVPGLLHSWWFIALIAALVVLVILLLLFVLRQGRGHTGTLFASTSKTEGPVIVDSKVAEQLLETALDGRSELVSSRVSTYDIDGTPVLKISATAKRGVSPRHVVDLVERHVAAMNSLLGRDIPAAIQVSGGFRARSGRATRLQ